MNVIFSLIITFFLAGFVTSIIAFFLHRASWPNKIKKSSLSFLNLFVTNIYQFNGKFLGVVSLSVSIASSVILGNALFIAFYCDSLSSTYCDIAKIFLAIVFIRVIILLLFYSLFYDKNYIED